MRNDFLKRVSKIKMLTCFFVVAIMLVAPSTVGAASSSYEEDGLAKALASERKISNAESLKRLKWQDMAGKLNAQLTKDFPIKDFGGVWIDKDTDRVQIGVLNDTSQRGTLRNNLERIVEEHDLNEAVDYLPVNYSYAELTTARDSIDKELRETVVEGKYPIQLGIKTNTNQVTTIISKDEGNLTTSQRDFLQDVKNKYGSLVNTETYSGMPQADACNWWYCDSPLRGAVAINGSDDYSKLYAPIFCRNSMHCCAYD